jgi:hypothetical protein
LPEVLVLFIVSVLTQGVEIDSVLLIKPEVGAVTHIGRESNENIQQQPIQQQRKDADDRLYRGIVCDLTGSPR